MWEEDPQTELVMERAPGANQEEHYKITTTENIIQLIEDHSQ
jgi:hypothetical protein